MTRLLPLLMLMLPLGHAWGQVYFDNLYVGPNGIGRGATLKTESGYLCWAIKSGAVDTVHLMLISETGELTEAYSPPPLNEISEMAGAVYRLNDTLYIGNVYRQDQAETNEGDPELIWFKSDGSYFERRYYGLPERTEINPGMIICSNGGFAFGGQVLNGQSPKDDGDGYLLRIDSLGNELWSETYGAANYEGFQSLLQTPDLGFLLLGWTRSFGAGQRDFYLVKTDSVGDQEWQRTYGGGGSESGACIIKSMDGNYLICGGGSDTFGKIIKVNPDGTQMWFKDYFYSGGTGGNYLYRIVELPNGEIVAAGGTNNPTDGDAGWLLKTDAEGNELWQRKYNRSNNTDLFYSVLLANDGGFLLSGQARNLETNSQDAWLLKVDSVGCPYPNCNVGVDELDSRRIVADVWPNPASDMLNVQWHTGDNAIVAFTDMLGRSYSSPAQEVQGVVGPYMQYDVSTFENGIYVLTIVQNSVKTTLKVVVEH